MLTLEKFSLEGQVAIVTGAGQGIGKGIAEGLANLGATVAAAEINATTGEAVAAGLRARGRRALAVATDVRDAASVQRMVETVAKELGRIDILVNNAGGTGGVGPGAMLDQDERDWETIFFLNAKSVYLCIRAVAPVMVRQRSGAIVNIASISAHVGHANLALYGAAKASVMSLTQALAGEMGPHGIRVNAVSPGSIVTPLSSQPGAGLDSYRDLTIQMTPLGRKGLPEDIAGAVAYLVSPAASFVTGQTILVDGGRWANGRIPQVPR